MARPGSVTGWTLDPDQRTTLIERYPARYEIIVAHHVTLASDAEKEPLPSPVRAAIVGHADDGEGVEAMVVAIDGGTDRPDGSTFHITWSLGPGRRARESNDVLKGGDWSRFEHSVPISLAPARI